MTSVFARTPFWLERENGLSGGKRTRKKVCMRETGRKLSFFSAAQGRFLSDFLLILVLLA